MSTPLAATRRAGLGELLGWAAPALALLAFVVATGLGPVAAAAVQAVAVAAAVFAAVHHAEVVAHRVGEPFGTLVLAVAVTVVEVALIAVLMLADPATTQALARDAVFAAVMIVLNGIVGVCLVVGGARHGEQGFQARGATAALAVLAPLTVLSLVLPNHVAGAAGPVFTPTQLGFAALASLALYGAFLFVQTVRHRDYFLPEPGRGG